MAKHRVMPRVEELLASRMQVRLHKARLKQSACGNFLALAAGQQRTARALFRAESAEDVKAPGEAVPHDPLAGTLGRFHDHIHPLGVGSEVAKIDDHFAADRVTLNAK